MITLSGFYTIYTLRQNLSLIVIGFLVICQFFKKELELYLRFIF